jgi:hypothetical protein
MRCFNSLHLRQLNKANISIQNVIQLYPFSLLTEHTTQRGKEKKKDIILHADHNPSLYVTNTQSPNPPNIPMQP